MFVLIKYRYLMKDLIEGWAHQLWVTRPCGQRRCKNKFKLSSQIRPDAYLTTAVPTPYRRDSMDKVNRISRLGSWGQCGGESVENSREPLTYYRNAILIIFPPGLRRGDASILIFDGFYARIRQPFDPVRCSSQHLL